MAWRIVDPDLVARPDLDIAVEHDMGVQGLGSLLDLHGTGHIERFRRSDPGHVHVAQPCRFISRAKASVLVDPNAPRSICLLVDVPVSVIWPPEERVSRNGGCAPMAPSRRSRANPRR